MEKERVKKIIPESPDKGSTRRGFLKKTAVAAAGGALALATAGCVTSQKTGNADPRLKQVEGKTFNQTLNHIVVDPEKCSGCRHCELVCSEHLFGVFNPKLSAIRVDREYGGPAPWVETHTCHQCPEAWCLSVCPKDALERDEKTGALLIDTKKCDGCGDCIKACPFGMIKIHKQTKKAFKCDLCGGDPQCVAECPMGALSLKAPIWYQGESGGANNG
jgi:Fe-S-cluster-containing hydrogenase component 2